MDVLMEMTWSDDIRRKGSRLAVPHFVSCLAWLWHPAQLAAGQWDGPGVKHCAVRTTSGRYLTVISQSGVLQEGMALDRYARMGYIRLQIIERAGGKEHMAQMQTRYEPPDLKTRERFPYHRWMRGEGIPIHFDIAGVADVTALPREPWARTGKGLGTFIELTGTY